jgi:MYXO-CTERM domain-containing protein
VFYVSGLACEGGNMPCDTGQIGACSVGRTDCAANGLPPVCRPVVQKGPEICDNVDNDCDGVIDNGDGLCTNPDKPFCFQGQCVGTCVGGEFPCPVGLECDASGHCSDPACASLTCMPGTACRKGECVDPCTGVMCPYGKTCQLGQCVDPCMGITCPEGRVCERGLCVANCSCRGCDTGLTCANDGRCTDPACANVNCEAGKVCKGGDCIDACKDVVCPGNAQCTLGVCAAPMSGDGSGGGGMTIDFGGNTGFPFPTAGSGNGPGGPSDPGGNHGVASKASGCGCRIADGPANLPTQLAWLGSAVALAFAARKRRHARKQVN